MKPSKAFIVSLLMSQALSGAYGAASEQLVWVSLNELGNRDRSYIKLDEEESVRDVRVAHARLMEATEANQYDALLVMHESSNFCGSGGCLFEILLDQPDGTMAKIMGLNVQEVTLGARYTNGMRNLRFNEGAVTWIWNGSEYEVR